MWLPADAVEKKVYYPVNKIIRDTVWQKDSSGNLAQVDTPMYYANESIQDTNFQYFNIGAKSYGKIVGLDYKYKLQQQKIIRETNTTTINNTILKETAIFTITPSLLYIDQNFTPFVGIRYKRFVVGAGYYPYSSNRLILGFGYELVLK